MSRGRSGRRWSPTSSQVVVRRRRPGCRWATRVVLLESMKMEIPVLTEVAGTVTTVAVAVGDVVQGRATSSPRWISCPRPRRAERASVSTLSFLLADHTPTSPDEEVAHLQRIVAEWQLLADMSFADFLLWVPVTEGAGGSEGAPPDDDRRSFVCVAQCSPDDGARPPHRRRRWSAPLRDSAAQHPQLVRAASDTGRVRRRGLSPAWHRRASRSGGRSVPVGFQRRGSSPSSAATRTSASPPGPRARWRSAYLAVRRQTSAR